MTYGEKAEKDIQLTFEFVRHILAHPEVLDEMPDTGELVFIEEGTAMDAAQIEKKDAVLVNVTRKYEFNKKVA
jgi:hypothetical protein